MDPHKINAVKQEAMHPDNSLGNSELPVEVIQILSASCQDEQCLDLRLQLNNKQIELEQKMNEVRQLEDIILDLTQRMTCVNCECNANNEADSGVMEMSTSQENVEKAIFVNGLKFAPDILANAAENIKLALGGSNDNESANLPENQFVQEENDALTFSPLKCSDEIDSGVQIDNEEEKNAGVVNFICPLGEQVKKEVAPEEFSSPQIDENIRNQLIENALQQNRKQMAALRDTWTNEERELFDKGIQIFGKDFFAIAKSIPTRKTTECVEYYYSTKHIALYKKKFSNKWNQTKKCSKPRILPIRKPEREKRQRTPAKSIEAEQKENVGQMQQKIGKKKEQKEKKDSEKYEVDYIFGKRPDPECEGKFEYRVFWKNYSRAAATWEPEENLKDCAESIQLYEKRWGR